MCVAGAPPDVELMALFSTCVCREFCTNLPAIIPPTHNLSSATCVFDMCIDSVWCTLPPAPATGARRVFV